MEEKLTVAVLFGGQSSEHEVSCMSVVNIVSAMDKEKYDIHMIGITKDGKWLLVDDLDKVKEDTWRESDVQAILSPDAEDHGILCVKDGKLERLHVDVVFPALHGMYGEDGTVQGLLELSRIPYVGCGVLASAISMDKVYTKQIVDTLGIRQARYVVIRHTDLEDMAGCIARVEETLDYPVFVKPSKAGSSRGVTKASDAAQLEEGLREAIRHDSKILVEETIVGREIECAVLGGYDPKASGVGEVLSADSALYSYEAKYFNADSRTDIHPAFPKGVLDEVRDDAVRIFKAVDGYGLARVDFFLEKDTNQVVFNEINTLPGFTGISMYPMLWADKGVDAFTLIDTLIAQAFKRFGA
ncbi:D-alanine-D-alanine ligase [Catenibacillus scindens]|uniref:D-alanine--D-alanine ligase n=1 Tax=Catenibacillus scindens TaxID=673271 RepID=A0A7W8M3L2_9FIRM|nr:D-alanine--D-alanine ligase family protein [Catenibacillus scindens]MBB5263198.1 D-alanine-D-alanine ligase [Catenibacillus scindens]